MSMIQLGKESFRTFDEGIKKEWLLTNGIGGFASSTIIGANTRRYHGLLVASFKPPVQRHLVLSKIDESLHLDGKVFELFANRTPDYTSSGYQNLHHIEMDPLPLWSYSVEDILVEKKIAMVYGKNTTCIVYKIKNGAKKLSIRLTPLVNFRDYHNNASRGYMDFQCESHSEAICITPYHLDQKINIFCSSSNFSRQENNWFNGMEYAIEKERGLQSTEDHYIPGYFEVEVAPFENKIITVIATTEGTIHETDGCAILEKEEKRIQSLIKRAGYHDLFANTLVKAADHFIVERQSTGAKTIIAGYPWFTDWGRDTMIALPGLTLVTGRFEDAKEILFTFSKYAKYGLLPNMFPDEGEEPGYNSVDAALWFFEASMKYITYSKDAQFIKAHIYETLKGIIHAFIEGTRYHIKMDTDGLITAGDEKTQLTWMDAKVGDWVVTPRHGKAVEINALWYNALCIMEDLSKQFEGHDTGYGEIATKAKSAFQKAFWYEEGEYLYDVVTAHFKDRRIRPNQIIAASLTYKVVEGEMAKSIVRTVWKELYSPYGLRSLAQNEEGYTGIYIGDQFKRDGSYHQGTVWAWLTGHFISAYFHAYGKSLATKETALQLLKPFSDHIKDACMGSISEIFDGNAPNTPRGCFAQAWSVAEVLRAYVEAVSIE